MEQKFGPKDNNMEFYNKNKMKMKIILFGVELARKKRMPKNMLMGSNAKQHRAMDSGNRFNVQNFSIQQNIIGHSNTRTGFRDKQQTQPTRQKQANNSINGKNIHSMVEE